MGVYLPYQKQTNNMENTKVVIGEYNNRTQYLSWECPFSDEERWCQGEFQIEDGVVIHNQYDQNDNLLYIVKA
jgi:hypothetical protein